MNKRYVLFFSGPDAVSSDIRQHVAKQLFFNGDEASGISIGPEVGISKIHTKLYCFMLITKVYPDAIGDSHGIENISCRR